MFDGDHEEDDNFEDTDYKADLKPLVADRNLNRPNVDRRFDQGLDFVMPKDHPHIKQTLRDGIDEHEN